MDAFQERFNNIRERALDNIIDTKLHKYYLNHPENKLLTNIIEEYHSIAAFNYIYRLRNLSYCYEELIKKDAVDIIYEIVFDGKSDDELVICVVCIKNNRLEILELLNNVHFDFNQILSNETSDQINILTYAYLENGLEMVKYLITLGSDINHGDGSLLKHACLKQNESAVDYLLTFEITDENLLIALLAACTAKSENTNAFYNLYMEELGINKLSIENINTTIINKIIDTGFSIAKYSKRLHYNLSSKPVVLTKLFLEKGLVINDNMPLAFACGRNNIDLVEFYLQYGLTVDDDVWEMVIENFNLSILELFLKYKIDLSKIKSKNRYTQIVSDLENLGLDHNVLLDVLFDTKTKISQTSSALMAKYWRYKNNN